MHAIADTKALVADGVISAEQAETIEIRAREAMVYLAVNTVLCLGILAATGGLIFWLQSPASVAIVGLLFLGFGLFILLNGNETLRMFGNAAALVGSGMLIGGASFELIDKYGEIAGPAMIVGGAVFALAAGWVFRAGTPSARFSTGAIFLMGLAMHLYGLAYFLSEHEVAGPLISGFYLYASVVLFAAGLMTDVRLVTASAIVPFAQALDTGTFYFHAAYVFYSPESTLSIIQMSLLIGGCVWVSARSAERTARHARVLAVMAFIVANLCALVGSLWGDLVGETIWGPGSNRYSSDMTLEEWNAAYSAFREQALYIPDEVYSILWAAALLALVFWAAHEAQRGLFNAALTFGGIHAYTQLFESFHDEPMAFAIGGLAAIPLAWGMWQLDRWIVAKRNPEPSAREHPK